MARTKQFDENQAIDSVMLKFWEKGYEGTSIQDLEECTGLNRTSLYNAFGNKQQVFERVMDRYKTAVLGELLESMEAAPTVKQGVLALLNTALNIHYDKSNPGGCLISLSVLESEQHDSDTREMLQQTVQELKRVLQARLNKGKKDGELSNTLDASGTATTIAATVSGMAILAKAGFSKSSVKKTINQVISLLD